jgi:nicotinic acid mononucleotide adenylyltransferase/nicotinamide mononucleotide (NMN) deamidase PncC
MHLPDPVGLIESLERADSRIVIVSTGGGSAAISHVLSTPGASGVVLEAAIPYAREAVDRLLGGPQETYCSSRAARRLAMAAWQRARALGAAPEQAVGIAVAASLRTRQPKRGEHRVFVALQTLRATMVTSVVLEKEARSRGEEEELAAALLLECLASVSQGSAPAALLQGRLRPGEKVSVERTAAPELWQTLLAGSRSAILAAGTEAAFTGDQLIFPGSFDPLHDGHRLMARIAEEIAERPIAYELSIANVDKPPLDYQEIESRAAQFRGQPLWLTRAATFIEKLAIFPKSTFVMGADTFVRLAEPKYYGSSQEAADRAVRTIAENARGLIVFGRARDGVFEEPATLPAPEPLRRIAYFVSQREFRIDISSTALRREQLACEPG